jgi:lipid-A-disaccharide synthase
MKYYLIAGEASGDLHGSKLMHGLKRFDPQAEFRYFGGDLMSSEGGTLVRHYRQTAVMGIFRVLWNFRKISRNLQFCREDILRYDPDAVVLIDYAGFNLRIARFASSSGFRVIYYISPKVWVWNRKRVYTIRDHVDKMFVILPFEVDFYRQYDYPVEYAGNPVVDSVDEKASHPVSRDDFIRRNGLGTKPIVALLAGSRQQEIAHCLPEMLAVTAEFTDHQFIIAGAPGISPGYYQRIMKDQGAGIVFNQTYELLMHAEAAIVTSGTATLETALFRVPQVVVYKMGSLTYFVGSRFVKPKYFSLVNLIMDREIVRELLQFGLRREIASELHRLLEDPAYRERMLAGYDQVREKLGEKGAHFRIAQSMVRYLKD